MKGYLIAEDVLLRGIYDESAIGRSMLRGMIPDISPCQGAGPSHLKIYADVMTGLLC